MKPVWLIAMKGLPGSGKSTLAAMLSRELGWPLIDKDDMKDVLHDATPDSGYFSYEIMFRVVQRQLQLGLPVICDSPLSFEALYQQARSIAAYSRAALAVIECRCSDDRLWYDRIMARQRLNLPSHHVTDWQSLVSYRTQFGGDALYPIDAPYLVVETTCPPIDMLTTTMDWLDVIGALGGLDEEDA